LVTFSKSYARKQKWVFFSEHCVQTIFYESPGERILKIGPHFAKVIVKHQTAFLWNTG